MVARWTCNQKIGGSNPVTVSLRTPVQGFFLIFKIKAKSPATSFCGMLFSALLVKQWALMNNKVKFLVGGG